MKKITSLLVFIAIATFAMAQQRSEAELKSIALETLSNMPTAGNTTGVKAKSAISRGQIQQLDSTRQMSVMGYAGGGFVIMSRDSRMDAVLAYGDTSYDKDNDNPGFNWWKQAMEESINYYLSTGKQMPKAAPSGSHKGVAQLLTTQWGQSTPYNNKAPKYGTTNYPIGCVATAMAQVMNYHEYPDKGVGLMTWRYKTYDADGNQTGTKQGSAVFSAANGYQWSNMLDTYTGSYTTAQASAVANLMWNCAASVTMDFNPSGSGSYAFRAADALRQYFKYNPYIRFYMRTWMPIDEWMNIIYTELDNNRPLLYGGQSSSGGHEFVCDGYNTDGKVHINWGWDGSQDGYFNVSSLNGFSSGQDLVAVTEPDDGGKYFSLFGFGGDFSASVYSGKILKLTVPYAYNIDFNSFSGTFAVIAADTVTGKQTVLAQTASVSVDGHGTDLYYHGTTPSFSNVDLSDLADGTYRLYIASKGATSPEINKVTYTWSDTDWQPVRSNENNNSSVIVTIGDGKLSVKDEKNANWVVTAISEIPVQKSLGDGLVRVYNASGILVYSAPSASFNVENVKASGLLIVKQGGQVRKIVKR